MTNVVSVVSAYEYRIKFDYVAGNMTLIFPYVVKTSNSGIKKVFIYGVEYKVRSKENYGNMFIVSGQEFSFKVATKYKLGKRVVPIVFLEHKHAVFRSVEFLDGFYIRLRYTPSNFNTTNTIWANYIATRSTNPIFITSNSTVCNVITTRNTASTFNNTNIFSAPVIANCRDTSWTRFGGIWSSCDIWMP